jgi:hypothetical protein
MFQATGDSTTIRDKRSSRSASDGETFATEVAAAELVWGETVDVGVADGVLVVVTTVEAVGAAGAFEVGGEVTGCVTIGSGAARQASLDFGEAGLVAGAESSVDNNSGGADSAAGGVAKGEVGMLPAAAGAGLAAAGGSADEAVTMATFARSSFDGSLAIAFETVLSTLAEALASFEAAGTGPTRRIWLT